MQVWQQPLMQRSKGGEIPAGAPPQPQCVKGSCARTHAYKMRVPVGRSVGWVGASS
jgi:hypothetical protein